MGEQVANNKELQNSITIVKHNGKYYTEIKKHSKSRLIRTDYYPKGDTLVYPTKWSDKKASMILVTHAIEEQKKIIEKTTEKLEGLIELKEKLDQLRD